MAKKYHQTRKDRRDESRGMEEYYEKEKRDSRSHKRDARRGEHEGDLRHALGRDPSWGRDSNAGMPSRLEMTSYPKNMAIRDERLNDTMVGIDSDSDHAYRVRKSDISYQK
jgi:hypothetical protein